MENNETLRILFALMLLASAAQACSNTVNYYPGNIQTGLFKLVNSSNQFTMQNTGNIIRICAPTVGAISQNVYLEQNVSISQIYPDSFDVRFRTLNDSTVTSGITSIYAISNNTALNSAPTYYVDRFAYIGAESALGGAQSMTGYCFGTSMGTFGLITYKNRTNVRFTKNSGDPYIHLYYGPDNVTWYEATGSPCAIPAWAQSQIKINQLTGIAGIHFSTNTGCVNVTNFYSQSNMSIKEQFRIIDNGDFELPNCNVTNTGAYLGESPYVVPTYNMTDSTGITPLFTYYPTCQFDPAGNGYYYIGTLQVSCPSYPPLNSNIIGYSKNDNAINTIQINNQTNETVRDICFQLYKTNAVGEFVNYIPDATIYSQYVDSNQGNFNVDEGITDGLGRVYFSIKKGFWYTISGEKEPDFPIRDFYINYKGFTLFSRDTCWPMKVSSLSTANSSIHVVNTTVVNNGAFLDCLWGITSLKLYGCTGSDEGSCSLSNLLFTTGSTDHMTTARYGVCEYVNQPMDFSGYSGVKSEIQYKDPADGKGKVASIFSLFNPTQEMTYNVINLAQSSVNQMCFKFLDAQTSTVIPNVAYMMTYNGQNYSSGNISAEKCETLPDYNYVLTANAPNYLNYPRSGQDGTTIRLSTSGTTNIYMYKPSSKLQTLNMNVSVVNSRNLTWYIDNVEVCVSYLNSAGTCQSTTSTGKLSFTGLPYGVDWHIRGHDGSKRFQDASDTLKVPKQNISEYQLKMEPWTDGNTPNPTIGDRNIMVTTVEKTSSATIPLCDVKIWLQAPGYASLGPLTTSGDSCSASFSNGQNNAKYTITAEKNGYVTQIKELQTDMQEVIMPKVTVAGTGECDLTGSVGINNGTVESYYGNVRVTLWKDGNFIQEVGTDSDGKYMFLKPIDCKTSYVVKSSYGSFNGEVQFLSASGGEGDHSSNIKITINLANANVQDIISQLFDNFLNLWPILFVMGFLLIIVVLQMLLDAIGGNPPRDSRWD